MLVDVSNCVRSTDCVILRNPASICVRKKTDILLTMANISIHMEFIIYVLTRKQHCPKEKMVIARPFHRYYN